LKGVGSNDMSLNNVLLLIRTIQNRFTFKWSNHQTRLALKLSKQLL